MAAIGLQNLRCEVVGSATNCALLLALVENLGCEAKISNLQSHIISEEEVAELEISVDNFARMHILHGLDQLLDVESSLNLMKALATFDQV